MPSLPEGWNLKEKPRGDGRVDIVGKDVTGKEYIARTTEEPGVTDRDLQLLSIGNRETSTAKDLVKFYQDDRERVNNQRADAMTDEYMDGADRVVHAGMHLSESRVGPYRGSTARGNFDAWIRSLVNA